MINLNLIVEFKNSHAANSELTSKLYWTRGVQLNRFECRITWHHVSNEANDWFYVIKKSPIASQGGACSLPFYHYFLIFCRCTLNKNSFLLIKAKWRVQFQRNERQSGIGDSQLSKRKRDHSIDCTQKWRRLKQRTNSATRLLK